MSINEYYRVLWLFVEYLWNNQIQWSNNKVLDIKNNFISTTNIFSNYWDEEAADRTSKHINSRIRLKEYYGN